MCRTSSKRINLTSSRRMQARLENIGQTSSPPSHTHLSTAATSAMDGRAPGSCAQQRSIRAM